MLIDDRGFELGMPTCEEMIRHQVVLLKHEREDAWLRLAKANEDIQRLIEINERLNHQIIDLRRELSARGANNAQERVHGQHSGYVPTWGMKMPSTEQILAEIVERDAKSKKAP